MAYFMLCESLDGADNEYTIKNKAKYSYYGR